MGIRRDSGYVRGKVSVFLGERRLVDVKLEGLEVRQQWEASRREAAEEGLFVAGEICKGKNISGRDGPLPYRLGRLKNEGHNSRRH